MLFHSNDTTHWRHRQLINNKKTKKNIELCAVHLFGSNLHRTHHTYHGHFVSEILNWIWIYAATVRPRYIVNCEVLKTKIRNAHFRLNLFRQFAFISFSIQNQIDDDAGTAPPPSDISKYMFDVRGWRSLFLHIENRAWVNIGRCRYIRNLFSSVLFKQTLTRNQSVSQSDQQKAESRKCKAVKERNENRRTHFLVNLNFSSFFSFSRSLLLCFVIRGTMQHAKRQQLIFE